MANKKRIAQASVPTVSDEEMRERQLAEAFEYAQLFAKQVNVPLWVLTDQSTKTSTTYTKYTKEQIIQYMQSPSANERNIRNASIYLYDVSSQYRRLINYFAGLLRWDYYMYPSNVDKSSVKPESFRKALLKAQGQVELMNLRHELTKASIIVLREGVLYGAIWQNKTSFYIQRINPDYCSLTSIEDGTWRYAVDMSKIQEKKLPLYPPEFETMYQEYKKTGQKMQEVPLNITFCLKADETTLTYSIPPYASVLPMLYDIETYKSLQETATKIANYKILGMQIPLNEDGTPKVEWNSAEKYYSQLCKVLPPYVGAFVSPMKTEAYTFERAGGVQDVDMVTRSEENFWLGTGTSALLHGSKTADTAGTLKLAIRADEELMLIFANQVERLINRILKDLSGTIKFKVRFLPTSVFNQIEQIELYRNAGALGVPGSKTAYAAALGITPVALQGMEYLESQTYNLDDWDPLRSSYNSKAETGVGNQTGRPSSREEDLDEEGEKTRDSDANANR